MVHVLEISLFLRRRAVNFPFHHIQLKHVQRGNLYLLF